MKKILSTLSILFFTVMLTGCEESFSPRSEFKEGYVLYSITPGQEIGKFVVPKVILAKVYDAPGTDPLLNTEDPEIAGARVEIKFRGDTYILKDSMVARKDSSRYKGPLKFYFGKAIPLYANDTITITARLQNGKVLTSGTKVPQYLNYENSIPYPRGFTTDVDPFKYGKNWTFYWTSQELNLTFPKMKIYYSRLVNNREVPGSIEVPLRVINRNGVETPIYPVANRDEEASYELASFDWAMNKISEGVEDKSQFRALHVIFESTEYDAPLSFYYSSVNGFLDNFSLRLDEQVFTNISGGYGLFGTYFTSTYQEEFDSRYVTKFGYRIK
ncbi:MAG: hypothetical protein LCH52_03120 [Bacteroidetes bacterium]|nr:hypothetical protein [Bacteroidota bacterium]